MTTAKKTHSRFGFATRLILPWCFMVGIITAAALLSGCNTIQGVGRDIQQIGESLDDAVNG